MVKINGVEATNTTSLKNRDVKPSLNEILDRMEKNNFDVLNNISTQSTFQPAPIEPESKSKVHAESNPANDLVSILGGGDDKSNLLLSVLPSLLSKNKNAFGFKNSQNMIFKELIKNSNNPKLTQLMELIPKLMSKQSQNQVYETQTTERQQPKIDSFVKTDDYIEK